MLFLTCFVTLSCTSVFDVLWSLAGKGLTSWLSFVMSNCDVVKSHWYPGSGVVLDWIDSRSLLSISLIQSEWRCVFSSCIILLHFAASLYAYVCPLAKPINQMEKNTYTKYFSV